MCSERLASLNVSSLVGRRVSITGIIKDLAIKSTKNGADMLSFNLVDNDVQRGVVFFNLTPYMQEKMNKCMGKVVCVVVDVKPYDKGEDGVSCVMYDIEVDDTADINEFIPAVKNIAEYAERANKYLTYCSGTVYGKIALQLMQDNWSAMSTIPAGHSQHHDLKGGLLMHTVCVADNCMNDYNTYSKVYGSGLINLPLLLCGALIHDIGKCFELAYDGVGGCDYTARAAIESHTVTGIRLIERVAAQLGCSDTDEVKELIHLVASHHDKLEWGAAVRPSSIEAIILSRADEKDAIVNKFSKKIRDIKVGEYTSEWSGGSQLSNYYRCMSEDEARENVELLKYSAGEEG